MTNLASELKQAFRRLRRAPVFLVVSVLTLGIGIGAFTSVFGLADAILFEEMPYESPEELAWVWRNYEWASLPRGWLSGPDIAELRKATDVFAAVVGVRSGSPNLTGGDEVEPERIRVLYASHELFDVLGVDPLIGRGFLPAEDSPDAGQMVVLGHDFLDEQVRGRPRRSRSHVVSQRDTVDRHRNRTREFPIRNAFEPR